MVETQKRKGNTSHLYRSIDEFVSVLIQKQPVRIHTFANLGFLGIGANWTASFSDTAKIVHSYSTDELENLGEKSKPIYDAMKEKNIPEVDGMIKISERNDAIYSIFQTDSPSKQAFVAKSYNDWLDAVKTLKGDISLRYLKTEDSEIIDAIDSEERHYLTSLDKKKGRTFEKTYDLLQKDPLLCERISKDPVEEVINWYLDMKG